MTLSLATIMIGKAAPRSRSANAALSAGAAMDECPLDVPAHIRSLCKATHALASCERRAMHKAAEISKEVQDISVSKLVAQSMHTPMIRSASSDGTTVKMRQDRVQ